MLSVGVDTVGAGYTSAPSVAITDANGIGSGATATAAINTGAISAINVTAPGSGYLTSGGIKKFQDDLPGLCDPASAAGCPTAATAKFIPVAVPLQKVYAGINADQYDIALVQYRTNFSSSLPAAGTLARGYVQIETPAWVAAHPGVSQHYPLVNELLDGTSIPILEGGVQVFGVTRPQWLGPVIVRDQGQARPHRLPQPAADGRRRRPLPPDRQHLHGRRHGPDGHGSARGQRQRARRGP